MIAVILDGSAATDAAGTQIREALVSQLTERGWNTEEVLLRNKKISPCAGDFFCWVRTPGTCFLDDDNRSIAEKVMSGDLLIYLTPVTFGGYSSILKGMVDHMIPNISPFFQSINGETHHKQRYKTYPDMMTIGWINEPDPQAETLFKYLTERNSINFFCKKHYSNVLAGKQSIADAGEKIREWLDDLESGASSPTVSVADIGPLLEPAAASGGAPKRALLLVGSPKTEKSVSHTLGQYLFQRMASRGVQTETVFLHKAARSPEAVSALLQTIDAVDVITLAFPLYVDSLPAPVTRILEKVCEHCQAVPPGRRPLFCAICNCGFPEAVHNTPALGICATFARQAGFTWGGGLSLGGGGMLSSRPLAEQGGRTTGIKNALTLAADALAQGSAIPREARELMSKPVIPAWAYRLMGGWGWRPAAKKYGVLKELDRTPYARK